MTSTDFIPVAAAYRARSNLIGAALNPAQQDVYRLDDERATHWCREAKRILSNEDRAPQERLAIILGIAAQISRDAAAHRVTS